MKPLTHDEARKFYDSFGEKQDRQFYEAAATLDLIKHSELETAKYIIEFGCGTGRFASRLLGNNLPDETEYLCVDISETMVTLCQKNIECFSDRARCYKNDRELKIPVPDQSADRFISTYVLDLLTEKDISALLAEAYRTLKPGGLLCLASLAHGTTLGSRLVAFVWQNLFRLHPEIVGGCRPINLATHLQGEYWSIIHNTTVISYGVPSEVLVATKHKIDTT